LEKGPTTCRSPVRSVESPLASPKANKYYNSLNISAFLASVATADRDLQERVEQPLRLRMQFDEAALFFLIRPTA
jgi:hypothetical protein